MRYRLVNQSDTEISFSLNGKAWLRILSLADAYGWQPMGVKADYRANGRVKQGSRGINHNGFHGTVEENGRDFILFEEALNLADALEEAFLEYIPQMIPAYDVPELTDAQPSMGVVSLLIDFCQQGAFWIEQF